MFCSVLKTLGDMNSRRGICSEISGANLPRHSPGKWQSICKEQWKCWENSVASWLGPRDKAVNKTDAGHLELLCSNWAFISHRTLSSPSNLGRKNFLAAFLGQQPVSLLPSSWGGGPVRAQGWLWGLMEVASSQCGPGLPEPVLAFAPRARWRVPLHLPFCLWLPSLLLVLKDLPVFILSTPVVCAGGYTINYCSVSLLLISTARACWNINSHRGTHSTRWFSLSRWSNWQHILQTSLNSSILEIYDNHRSVQI